VDTVTAGAGWENNGVELRISLITLGMADLARSCRFYRDGLGLPTTRSPEDAYTPSNASWLNRIEAQFTALRYFALDGTDHATHDE
jgi:catechol 2,3-dioxygenase-like lactoylglutathione lyase family enzyme